MAALYTALTSHRPSLSSNEHLNHTLITILVISEPEAVKEP
jgi:hypothetical protein